MRRSSAAIALLVLVSVLTPRTSQAANPHIRPLVDSLAGVETTTSFSVFGSAGLVITRNQLHGPRLVLERKTTITEIGAYLNNCINIVAGVADCPDRQPFIVQIRPATSDGLPDPSVVLATYQLSDDRDPLLVSFEAVSVRLKLRAGTYFALFGAQRRGDRGMLLINAQIPFAFEADHIPFGSIRRGLPFIDETGFAAAAVRILGR